ncbi:hypothetical protein [Streptomyces sp. Root1310]|uniref:hypothetical protein n=1 Tax=Streptomyces sp. Root1310 TaxID=1736452 RepID=UPI00070D8F1D|nr:hypothetical protein [Streptomyces sp. Root1310]KQX80746.1 hypothetical protein ASD48_32480 [Streptomyces sp. Root1310]
MSAPTRPPLKSITTTPAGPNAAPQPVDTTAAGVPKVAARKGVRTAVSPDPQQGDGRYAFAWLHICAPRGTTPTATSRCLCGWDRSAVGRDRVLALIEDHTDHRDACPLRNPQEGRAAA